jgi:hypothetical protein
MLRVIRTELYFNPLEIKWQFPELIISNPGISAAFFRCDPERFDFEKVISSPSSDIIGGDLSTILRGLAEQPTTRELLVRAFLDRALQNAPFAYGLEPPHELNTNIIDKIYGESIIVEQTPPKGIPFRELVVPGTSIITVGTYVASGDILLCLKVAAGIIIIGGAVAIVRAFDKGLTHVVERAIGSKDKTPARSTATTTRRRK